MVTGVAGFIGSSLAQYLLSRGDKVTGIDNLNDYYDVSLKRARLKLLKNYESFDFQELDISDRIKIDKLFSSNSFEKVVNLAAQAGVRYSIENPSSYIDSNIVGFANILEGCRHKKVTHLVYASSSSVYGSNTKLPFSEKDNVDHPISLYAASKKSNELMAHAYSHLYKLPTTGLRFFTVYGPWGRPDMALFKFTKGIIDGSAIPVYNQGNMIRDFTYIDDIVEGIVLVLDGYPSSKKIFTSGDIHAKETPWEIYNIGNSNKIELMNYIKAIEKALDKKAVLDLLPMQDGDVPATEADMEKLKTDFGFTPKISVEEGVSRFVEWYCKYYPQKKV